MHAPDRSDPSTPIAPSARGAGTGTSQRLNDGARSGEQGSITILVVILFLAILAAAGLVVDGGAKLRAARQASAVAEEAARAGAGRVNRDQAYAHGGSFVIDRTSAVAAARNYLSSSGVTGSVAMTGTRSIRVTVTVDKPTVLLSLIGIGHLHVTRTATADLLQGIRQENR
jgi:Flp pilus assembly protein TadG